MAKGTFDLPEFAAANGFEILGAKSPGVLRVRNAEGQEGEFNTSEFLKSNGVNPSEVSININSADTPLNTSVVEGMDRAKLALGNAKGGAAFLKNKFQDARINTDGELVVNSNGAWHRVDPEGFGDGNWKDMVQEFGRDIADLTDVAINTGAAAAATALAPVTGGASVLAAGAAGGAAKGITTILGNIAGTYKVDSPQEVVKDIAWDMALGMGGQALSLGSRKLFVPKLKMALEGMNDTASPATKEMLASYLESTAGVNKTSVMRGIDRHKEVGQYMSQAIEAAGRGATEDKVIVNAANNARRKVAEAAEAFPKALSENYGMQKRALLDNIPNDVVVPLGETMSKQWGNLQSMGLVRNVEDKWVAQTPEFLAEHFGITPFQAKQLAPKMLEFVDNIDFMQKRAGGVLKGKEGVEAVMNMRRNLDDLYYGLVDANPAIESSLTQVSKPIRDALNSSFRDAGVAGEVTRLSEFYKGNLEAKRLAMQVGEGGAATLDGFVSKFFSDPAKHRGAKDLIDRLESMGGRYSKLATETLDRLAAVDMVRTSAKGSFGAAQQGIIGKGLNKAANLAMNPRRAVQMINATDQMLQSTPIKAALKARNMFWSMPKEQLRSFLADPKASAVMFQTIASSQDEQDSALQQLMKQGGL